MELIYTVGIPCFIGTLIGIGIAVIFGGEDK